MVIVSRILSWLNYRSSSKNLIYLLVGFILIKGLTGSFLTPVFQLPDEQVHWMSAERLYFSNLWEGQGKHCTHESAMAELFDKGIISRQANKKMPIDILAQIDSVSKSCFLRMHVYPSKLSYPGVLFGLGIQKLLNLPLSAGFFLSRILTGLFVLLAILIILFEPAPESELKSSSLLILPLMLVSPLGAQSIFAVTADAMVFFHIVLLVPLFWSQKNYTRRFLSVFLFSIIACVMTKPMYVLPALVVLFGRCLIAPFKNCGVLFICSLSSLLLVLLSSDISNSTFLLEQKLVFLTNPLKVSVMLLVSAKEWLDPQWLFYQLGWLDHAVSFQTQHFFWLLCWSVGFYVCIELANSWSDRVHNHSRIINKEVVVSLIFFCLVFLSVLLTVYIINLSIYLSYTPVGAPLIVGIQARYYLVLEFLIIMALLTFVAALVSQLRRNRAFINFVNRLKVYEIINSSRFIAFGLVLVSGVVYLLLVNIDYLKAYY